MSTSSSSILAAQNKAAMDYYIQTPVTREMVTYLAQKAASVIRCDPPAASPDEQLPTPPTTPPHRETSVSPEPGLPPLEDFITSIVQQSHVQVPTLMPTLIYLARLQAKLPPVAQGIPSTVHRIFLAALILAAKNLNDSSPKNKHWARYTTVPGYPEFGFTNSEVNLMEKQLLYLLDWDLRITNDDLYFHLEPFLAPIRVKQQQHAERKMQAMLRERERTQQLQQAHAQFELRQQQRRRLQSQTSISVLASSQSQLSLPHIISQARLSVSRPVFDSPQNPTPAYTSSPAAVASSTHSRSGSLYPPSRSSSRAPPMRTPSLSPPSRCDSSASYASSVGSASPASFMAAAPPQPEQTYATTYPAKPQEAKVQLAGYYDHDEPYQYQYSLLQHDLPEVVHIQPPNIAVAAPVRMVGVTAAPKQQKTLPPRPQELEDNLKPAKKLKTSAGNLFSRFLGGNGGQAGNNPAVVAAAAC